MASAETPIAGGDTMWPCPMCTLENTSSKRQCDACGSPKPPIASITGQGRVLRPRARAVTPPVIGSFTDEADGDDDDHSHDDDADDDEDFAGPTITGSKEGSSTAGSAVKGRKRTRPGSGGGVVRGRRRRGETGSTDSGYSTDSVGDGTGGSRGGARGSRRGIVTRKRWKPDEQPIEQSDQEDDEDVVMTAVNSTNAGAGAGTAITAEEQSLRSPKGGGAQQRPLELDDSDRDAVSCEDGGQSKDEEDDDDLNGETPVLLGRGWRAKDRRLAKERKLARDRAPAGGHVHSSTDSGVSAVSGVAARRGRKRQRPSPSTSVGDDLFRARKFPLKVKHGGGDDLNNLNETGEDWRPLSIRRRAGVAARDETRRENPWRWPPPAPAVPLSYVAGMSERETSNSECGSLASRDEGATESEGETGGSASGGTSGVVCDGDGRSIAAFGQLQADPVSDGHPEQKPRKKRSRLSLRPKRVDGDGGAENDHPLHGSSHEARPADDPQSLDQESSGPAGALESSGRSATGLRLDEKEDVEGPVTTRPGLRSATVAGNGEDAALPQEAGTVEASGGDAAIETTQGTEDDPRGAARHGESMTAPEDDRKSAVVMESSKQRKSAIIDTGAEDMVSTASRHSSAAVAAITGPTRLRMAMDMGDSDSDSSDGSEMRDRGGAAADGQGAVHLGLAMDEAKRSTPTTSSDATANINTAACSAAAAAAAAAASATAALAIAAETPQMKASTPRADSVDKRQLSSPQRISRSPERGNQSRGSRLEESPEPAAMGLLDTPPPVNGKNAGGDIDLRARDGEKAESARKSPHKNKELQMLEWSGGSPSQKSPVSEAGGRGEWPCLNCTFVNRARAKACMMCQSIKSPKQVGAVAASRTRRGSRSDAAIEDGSEESGENVDSQPHKGRANGAAGGRLQWDPTLKDKGENERKNLARDGVGEVDIESRVKVLSGKSNSRDEETSDTDSVDNYVFGAGSDGNSGVDGDAGGTARGKRGGYGAQGTIEGGGESLTETESDEDMDYDDDDDYQEEGEDDQNSEDAENVGSQILERFLRSSQDPPARGARSQRHASRSSSPLTLDDDPRQAPQAQVLDLTETGGDHDALHEARALRAAAGGVIEDISDEDDDSSMTGFGAHRQNGDWDPAGEGRYEDGVRSEREPPRKYRFFASVEEHRDRQSSCVDFASLGAAPAGDAPGSKSYEARKRVRDDKANRSKRGKKGRRGARASSSAGRGRGSAGARGSRGRGKAGRRVGSDAGGTGASRPGVQSFGRGSGVPPASWIPTGVANGLSSASGGLRGGSAGSFSRAAQPFNHYRGNDQMVDDSNGGGGLHWEHAGASSFGD